MKKSISISRDNISFSFELRDLDISYIENIVDLTNSVQKEISSKGHSNYMLHRDRTYYENMLNDENDLVCGVLLENNLVAVSCHHHCKSKKDLDKKFPYAECKFDFNSVGIFSSVCVQEEYRGLGLLGCMNDFIHELAGFEFSVTTVKLDNKSSLKGFLKKDYMIIKSVISPVDGASICLLVKDHYHSMKIEEIGLINIDEIVDNLKENKYIIYCHYKDKLKVIKLNKKWF